MYNIEWWGNGNTNKSSRGGVKPFVIVDHIAEGSLSSVDNWFTDKGNKQSSAHFCVGKKGEIHQYVKIEDYAWSNGLPLNGWLDPDKKLAPVIRDMNTNPNYYTVSIEHEGDTGELTEDQFYASCWLHRYIMDYVRNNFGVKMALGNYNVISHSDIDPVRKPCCPGDLFPWKRLFAELAIAEKMTLPEYEMHIQYVRSGLYSTQNAVAAFARMKDLYGKLNGPYNDLAVQKLCKVYGFLKDNDLLDG